MRRAPRWILALALVASPMILSAQGTAVSWGLIGGVNLSSVTGDVDGADKKMKPGFDLGLTMQRRINDMWTFNGEAHWSMKGVTVEDGGDELSVKLNYLEIPLIFRGMSTSGEMKPFVELGGAAALKMNCDIEAKSGGVTASVACEDVVGEVKSFDLGLVGGVGLQWMVGGRPWTLGARYNMGLMTLSDDADEDGKNVNIQFLLGFRFL
jgi:hypothetical protein